MTASEIDAYIARQPEERRDALTKVRKLVRESLERGFEEGMQYGMPSWYVPLSRYPDTYNGEPLTVVSLGSPKSHMALYLHAVYMDEELRASFESAWEKTGKKLDMGKACLRWKKLENVALDVVAETLARVSVEGFLTAYERGRAGTAQAAKKTAAKKTVAKKRR